MKYFAAVAMLVGLVGCGYSFGDSKELKLMKESAQWTRDFQSIQEKNEQDQLADDAKSNKYLQGKYDICKSRGQIFQMNTGKVPYPGTNIAVPAGNVACVNQADIDKLNGKVVTAPVGPAGTTAATEPQGKIDPKVSTVAPKKSDLPAK